MAAITLSAAHKRGIVHRDVKPENLFVTEDSESLYVLDFGIAHMPSDPALTVPGQRVGTPQFMAPEYLMSAARLDGRTDIYALGLVLWCAVAGRDALPRAQDHDGESLRRAAQAREPVRKLVPELPEEVAQVIERAAAVEVTERYPTMGALRAAIEDLLRVGWRYQLKLAAGAMGIGGLMFAAGFMAGQGWEAKQHAAAWVETGRAEAPAAATAAGHHQDGEQNALDSSGDDSSQEGSDMNKVTKAVAVGTMVVGAVVATPKHGVSGKPPQPCQMDSDCKKKEACKPAGSLGNWCAKTDPKKCPAQYRFTDRAPEPLRGKCWVPPTGRYDPAIDY